MEFLDRIVTWVQIFKQSRVALASVILFLVCTNTAHAEVIVESAWSRATVPGATTGVIYATLKNAGQSDVVITGAASDAAGMVMIHETAVVDGVMKMRHRDQIRIPAGERLLMKPGGTHIMLMGLKNGLKQGDKVTATVSIDSGEPINFSAPIGSIGQLEAP